MAVQIEFEYKGQLNCSAVHTPSRCQISTDAPIDNGGKGQSFSPTDLVATALGTCMLTVMGLVAEKEGLEIAGTKATVVKGMVAKPQRRIGTLQVKISLPKGRKFSLEQKQKLEHAALYCPVQQSLNAEIEMPVEFHYPD